MKKELIEGDFEEKQYLIEFISDDPERDIQTFLLTAAGSFPFNLLISTPCVLMKKVRYDQLLECCINEELLFQLLKEGQSGFLLISPNRSD